jgi:[ribosomal protein S5]-alanine N-acetyltransferase
LRTWRLCVEKSSKNEWFKRNIHALFQPKMPQNPHGYCVQAYDSVMNPPEILTPRCLLRVPSEQDAPATVNYMQRNRAHFAPTDPPLPPEFYAAPFHEKYARDAHAQFVANTAYRFNVFLRAADPAQAPLIARVNFTQVFLGPFRSCVLGYGIDGAHEGKGLMLEAVGAAIDWLFSQAKLHRVQAGYLPENARSAALLKRLGFTVIGTAPNYLFINGVWRDHVITQKINAAYPADRVEIE